MACGCGYLLVFGGSLLRAHLADILVAFSWRELRFGEGLVDLEDLLIYRPRRLADML